MEILKILLPIVIAHVAVLIITIVIIKKMLVGDTVSAVSRIRQVEAEVRKKEEAMRTEITAHEKEFAEKKIAAEEDLERQRKEADKDATKIRDQLLADANKDAERIMEQAKNNEAKLRQQISQDMEEKAVNYGAEVFKLVFSEKINDQLNRAFIDELLGALEEVDAVAITVDASETEFASSHPIAQDQRERLQTLLNDKFGAKIEIKETVKPELLAGLVFKLGSLEIDGSLLNRYQEAAAEVKKTAGV